METTHQETRPRRSGATFRLNPDSPEYPMRLEYNPRNVLRPVPAALLQDYFEQRRLLADFPWVSLDGDVEPLYEAWMALPPLDRQVVSVDFQRMAGLCSKQGIQTLLDAGRSVNSDVVPVMAEGKSNVEKVFRVLLAKPDVFRVASQFSWADNLTRYWHRRRDLPQVAPDLGDDAQRELKRAISDYYKKNQDRGEYCHIEVYPRGTAQYVMIYLADYPAAVVCFESSDQLKRSLQQPAFDVVFIFDGTRGRLYLYAEGGCELRKELAQRFARHVLRQEITVDAITGPVFELDRLKDPDFRFKIEPSDGLAALSLKSIRLAAHDREPGVITFARLPRSKNGSLHGFVKRGLNTTEMPLEDLHVEYVTIQAKFTRGSTGPASVTFSLSANSCNLKDTPEHNKIRECLKRSEVLCE